MKPLMRPILRSLILLAGWVPSSTLAQSPLLASPRQGLNFTTQTVVPPVLPALNPLLNAQQPLAPFSPYYQSTGPLAGIRLPIIVPSEPGNGPVNPLQQQQEEQQQQAMGMALMQWVLSASGSEAGSRGVPGNPSYTGNGGWKASNLPAVHENYGQEMGKYPAVGTASGIPGHACNSHDTDRLTCMVCNIYFEAAHEPYRGQVLVGQTVMTREFSNSYVDRYHSDTACKTVYADHQYSWTFLYPPDKRILPMGGQALDQAVAAAEEALKKGPDGITNYYNPGIVSPAWGNTCQVPDSIGGNGMVGQHRFCIINGTQTRTTASVMASEGISPLVNSLAETPAGAVNEPPSTP